VPDLKFRRAYSNVDREAVQAMFSQFDTNKVQPGRPSVFHRIRSSSTHSSLFMPMLRPYSTPPPTLPRAAPSPWTSSSCCWRRSVSRRSRTR
jgi:hypothetical protein